MDSWAKRILMILCSILLAPTHITLYQASGEQDTWITSEEIDWNAFHEFVERLENPPPLTSVKENDLVFELPDLEGNLVSLSDSSFENKIVLVDIWGTSCGICLAEMPSLVELYRKYGKHGFEIIAIAFESGPVEERIPRLQKIKEKLEIPFAFLYGGEISDVTKDIANLENYRGFPTTLFIGRDGKVKRIRVGAEDPRFHDSLESATARLLGLPPPPVEDEGEEEEHENQSPEFGGVGIRIVLYSEKRFLTVIEPIKGGPAARSGVLAGDIIVEIDGFPTEDIKLEDAIDRIKGPVGTSVRLRAIREQETTPVTFDIMREIIKT